MDDSMVEVARAYAAVKMITKQWDDEIAAFQATRTAHLDAIERIKAAYSKATTDFRERLADAGGLPDLAPYYESTYGA